MKHLYLLLFSFIISFTKAQFPAPNVIYYPNTINTPTVTSLGYMEYLCGPNTVVYDTIGHACRIYVSNNCTVTLKTTCSACVASTGIFLQGNSVVNILPGNCYNYYVVSEPNATVNNPMNVPVSSNTVTTITWPTVNCTVNGIRSNSLENENLILYPNPASDELNISFNAQTKIDFNKVLIYNSFGQLIREEEISFKNNSASINTTNLPNGVYYLNLNGINKRFVIAH